LARGIGVVGALVAVMAVHASLEPTTSAFASNFGVELNGTYRVISNGNWAKSNEVFLDEKTVVQTWTVTSSCTSPISCTGTVTSDRGWSAPVSTTGDYWIVDHVVEDWVRCPDGTQPCCARRYRPGSSAPGPHGQAGAPRRAVARREGRRVGCADRCDLAVPPHPYRRRPRVLPAVLRGGVGRRAGRPLVAALSLLRQLRRWHRRADLHPRRRPFDNTPSTGGVGVLLGFLEGAQARALGRAPLEQRRDAVIGCFARFFGPRAKEPIEYVERAWAEEIYSRGCYAGYLPPGTWTSLGFALRRACGRIHWAGTETAEVWNGYMDGAISSGERAAHDVLAAGLPSGTAARSELAWFSPE